MLRLLTEEIEKPELSEREKKLFKLVQTGKSDELSQRLEVFRNKETEECPYCYQLTSSEYKESLVENIVKVLSKEVEIHQTNLRNQILDPIAIDLSPYGKLSICQTCVDLLVKINGVIQENNEYLKRKIENPYQSIDVEVTQIKPLATQLVTVLADLEKSRNEYNQLAKRTGPIVRELHRINSEIACYDVKPLANQLDKQLEDHETFKKLYQRLQNDFKEKREAVEKLVAERSSVRIALEAINACIKYIFFAEERLKIEYVDGAYKLLSNGKSVKPNEVSVGERNVIALSYFFTSILEKQDEIGAYAKEYLLIIDDPVSSFDLENRIGILSFLKYKLSKFLLENRNTKALVMTHDLTTFYDLHKVFEEIMEAYKCKGYPIAPKFNCFEIRDRSLKSFAYKNRHEYTEIVKLVYKYASGQADDCEFVIGNIMRQMLEAFSTFEYKKGIESVSTNETILGLLKDSKYISYYRNLMYRLVLHGGSHKEEQVKAMNDFHFFSLISETEKKRTAKEVLCFIYLLNQRHLLEHLRECGDVETTLKSWCVNIKARAAEI